MTFDEWFVKYPLPAEIDTMDETDREQWKWALRSAYKTGAAAEREACVKVCEEAEARAEELWDKFSYPEDQGIASGARQCAAAIRARGQA
jgi:hypothetical protein